MNRTTVYTHALNLLGEINYKKHTATDGVCVREYPDAVRLANSIANWSFARTKRVLAPLAPKNADGIFAYNLPADCLRVLEVRDTATQIKVRYYSIFGRILEVYGHSSDNITLVYTSDLLACREDLPDEAPQFCEYVIYLLAAKIAPTVTGNIQLAAQLNAEATQRMHAALTADRQQARSNDQHPLKGLLENNIIVDAEAIRDNSYYKN